MPREPDLLPDWFVGGAGKRKLLRALVRGEAGPPPLTKKALAAAAELHPKHTVFRHLEVLVTAELLIESADGYRVNDNSALIPPIRALIEQLDLLEPRPLPPSRGVR
jgi:hypothetical protein